MSFGLVDPYHVSFPKLLRLCLAHWGTQYTDAIDDDNHRGTLGEYSLFTS